MTEDKKKEQPKKDKKKVNGITIIVVILSVLVIAQGGKIIYDIQDKKVMEEKFEEEQQVLASTLQQLTDIRGELDVKIAEIEKLGGDVEELETAKAEIEAELANSRRINRNTIRRLQGKVEGYEALLVAKDKEIEELQALNDELYSENTDLKSERNQLNRTISELNLSKDELELKIDIASELRTEDLAITGLNSRGKERIPPFKARQLDQLKIEFKIAENEVAPIEGKEIMIRILDPQDNVLFDVTKGSGTFMLDGKEEFFTAKQEILFDNSNQLLTFMYSKGSEYEIGLYNIQIYTSDYLMGYGEFTVQ